MLVEKVTNYLHKEGVRKSAILRVSCDQHECRGRVSVIRDIEVRNFRCYEKLSMQRCGQLNVIVGENGSGKTAVLESIFLTLASSTELAARFRAQRGIDPGMSGSARRLEEALFGDLFYNGDLNRSIDISLVGDGREARSLTVSKTAGSTLLPFSSGRERDQISTAPLTFIWRDANGKEREVSPKVSATGLVLPDTGEDLPDFFFFPAMAATSSLDTAMRFSDLSKSNREKGFVQAFCKEYPLVRNLNVEVHAGAPLVFASIGDDYQKVPLANLSSGINRVVAFTLTLCTPNNSVLLVDEVDNGIYFSHLQSIWNFIISLCRTSKSQMFVSTHSKECLDAINRAATSANWLKNVVVWRTERTNGKHTVERFTGEDMAQAIKYNEEIR